MFARSVFYLMIWTVVFGNASSPWAAPPAQNNVARLYQEYCSVCHGEKGDGKSRVAANLVPRPRDFRAPMAAGELTRDRIIHSISEGRPGTAMAAWKNQLNPIQIAALADYIRDRFMVPTAYDTSNEGRRLYAEYCSVCHGDKGDGKSRAARGMRPPPRDFSSELTKRELTRDRMIFAITYGRANTAMPGWKTQLDKKQIAAVADYIRRNFMELDPGLNAKGGQHKAMRGAGRGSGSDGHGHRHRTPGGNPAAYFAEPFPNNLKGNLGNGKNMYQNNCVPCHGAKGDGQGPRAFFILPKPRDFTHPAARASFNRPHLFEAIAKGKLKSEMSAWDKVLSPQQIADISEYVFRAFIRPPNPATRKVEKHGSRPHLHSSPGGKHR